MEGLSAGEVVFVPYPYTDLSATKLRPAVVLAAIGRGDIVLCQITSNPYSDPLAVEIATADFSAGSLRRTSYARPGKLFTGHDSVAENRIGRLRDEKILELIEAIVRLLRQGR